MVKESSFIFICKPSQDAAPFEVHSGLHMIIIYNITMFKYHTDRFNMFSTPCSFLFFSYEFPHIGHLMKMREAFFGGRTEVFAALCDISKLVGYEIKFLDVCSMYPYMCMHMKLPIGVPEILFGKKIDKNRLSSLHENPYFGFARIKVRPNKNDLIAILPRRLKGEDGDEKLMYDLEEKEGN